MADKGTRGAEYDEARRSFDELEMEEQTRFLVEAAASTMATGLRQAGEALADGLEEVVRQARSHRAATDEQTKRPGAAEPETSQRKEPRTNSDT